MVKNNDTGPLINEKHARKACFSLDSIKLCDYWAQNCLQRRFPCIKLLNPSDLAGFYYSGK
jgi:hypothetical protein